MLQWALATAAGVATVASPCVLPLLPFLLGMAVDRGSRTRPLFIVLGFVLSFVVVALLFGESTRVLGISPDAVRTGSATVLLATGLLMLLPHWGERLLAPLGGLANLGHRLGARTGTGPMGGLLLGCTLGAVWTPCAGPVLASILALVANSESAHQAAPLLAAYAAGAGLPMLAIAYGGQTVMARTKPLMMHATRIRQGFGALVMITAAAMITQYDVQATAWLSHTFSRVGLPEAEAAPVTAGETAPDFVGIDEWINSPPLNLPALKGKVVLVDFWTYACVNCVRTLPHIQKLHDRYKDKGLVVVGVHSPEFPFERSIDNLRAAVRRYSITYPVAQDNQFKTWESYRNQYWPAQYLVDQNGQIIFRHFGEGDEELIESKVRQALGLKGPVTPSRH